VILIFFKQHVTYIYGLKHLQGQGLSTYTCAEKCSRKWASNQKPCD